MLLLIVKVIQGGYRKDLQKKRLNKTVVRVPSIEGPHHLAMVSGSPPPTVEALVHSNHIHNILDYLKKRVQILNSSIV